MKNPKSQITYLMLDNAECADMDRLANTDIWIAFPEDAEHTEEEGGTHWTFQEGGGYQRHSTRKLIGA